MTDIKAEAESVAAPFEEITEHMPNAPVAPAHGIAAIALSMALKYHHINTVQDGTLYQQYKLEGRNLETLHLEHVFETAIKMEMHLLGASDRIAKVLVDCIAVAVEEDEKAEDDTHSRPQREETKT